MSLLLFLLIPILPVLAYLVLDYAGPARIPLKATKVSGMSCMRAKDLIVQEYDKQGNLWATRGMIIYRLLKGDSWFIRMAHVPTGLSVLWLNNFSLFRWFTKKNECIELVVSEKGSICAFSAGYIVYGDSTGKKFIRSLKLPHYGFGVGRGILSNGLLRINDNQVFFGEYFRNEERIQVNVFSSDDFGLTWNIAYAFQPGSIRHIHALHQDPFTGKIWICTGDNDVECMIGQSDSNYRMIDFIGQGSQVWRSCHLVFSEDAVFWGTDTGSENISGIYRWDKREHNICKLHQVDGAVFFGTRLENGTIVLSTDREGFPNERDDKTRLYLLTGNTDVTELEFGTWNHKKPGFRFGFAKLRFQRNQGSDSLAISVLNHKEFPEGTLIIFSEEELKRIVLSDNERKS